LILTRDDVGTVPFMRTPRNNEQGLSDSVMGSHEVLNALGFEEVMSQNIENFKINYYKFDSEDNARKIYDQIKEEQYQRGGFTYYGTQVNNADCYGLQKSLGSYYAKFSLYCVKSNVYFTVYSAIVFSSIDQVDLGIRQHDGFGQKVVGKFN